MESNINLMLKNLLDLIPTGSMNEPLQTKQLTQLINSENLNNPEIRDLYSYKNGSYFDYNLQANCTEVCSFGYFLPLQSSIEIMKSNNWNESDKLSLLPLISSYSGDFLLINQNYANEPIFIYSPSLLLVTPEPIFNSLDILLRCLIECYKTQTYRIIENKLVVDMDKEDYIFKKNDSMYLKWSENNN